MIRNNEETKEVAEESYLRKRSARTSKLSWRLTIYQIWVQLEVLDHAILKSSHSP
jgi:hypothetical protein